MLQNLKFKKDKEPSDAEKEIAKLYRMLKDHTPETKEYAAVADQIVKLQKLHNETISRKRVSPDTLANAATNLTGILFILNYEHARVFTSRAASFVMKNIK